MEKSIFDDLYNIFKMIDHDNDNFINIDDLKLFLKELGENLTDYECDQMIKVADKSKLGKLNYSDFKEIMDDF